MAASCSQWALPVAKGSNKDYYKYLASGTHCIHILMPYLWLSNIYYFDLKYIYIYIYILRHIILPLVAGLLVIILCNNHGFSCIFLFFRKFCLLKSYAPEILITCLRIFLFTFKSKITVKWVKIRFTVCGSKKKGEYQIKKSDRNFISNHIL